MVALSFIAAVCSSSFLFVEPTTGTAFDACYATGETTLVLTGADRRRVMGRDAYAVAHYADLGAAREALGLSLAERREFHITSPGPKLIVFHGLYSKVPARGIRWSWSDHFRALDKAPHESFIDAFQKPFRKGERLYFVATADGALSVYHDTVLLGAWKDEELINDVWRMCLGDESEIVSPDGLVSADVSEHALAEAVDSPVPMVQIGQAK